MRIKQIKFILPFPFTFLTHNLCRSVNVKDLIPNPLLPKGVHISYSVKDLMGFALVFN